MWWFCAIYSWDHLFLLFFLTVLHWLRWIMLQAAIGSAHGGCHTPFLTALPRSRSQEHKIRSTSMLAKRHSIDWCNLSLKAYNTTSGLLALLLNTTIPLGPGQPPRQHDSGIPGLPPIVGQQPWWFNPTKRTSRYGTQRWREYIIGRDEPWDPPHDFPWATAQRTGEDLDLSLAEPGA